MNDPFTGVDFESLYYDFNAVMHFLRKLPDTPAETGPIDFHMYWKTVRPFGRKQILPIKSFIATQPEHYCLTLWSNTDLTTNELLKPWLSRISFRIYNPVLEGDGTLLEGARNLVKDDPMVYSGGDLFRALILHNYGGVYVDMDSVFLRPFSSLMATEFMYKWSFQPTMISSAVMRLHRQSELAQELLHGILELPYGGTNWGCQNNMRAYAKKPFRVFPCAFFNPEWQVKRTLEQKAADPDWAEPFKVNSDTHTNYEGAFVWHWHNRWEETISPGCKFEILEQHTDNRLRELGLL